MGAGRQIFFLRGCVCSARSRDRPEYPINYTMFIMDGATEQRLLNQAVWLTIKGFKNILQYLIVSITGKLPVIL